MTDLRALAEAAPRHKVHVSIEPGEGAEAAAAYLMALHPTVVLALLDVVDAARALRDFTHLMHDTEYDTDPLWQALYRYEEVSRDPA